ncbi:MAG: phospho-sugar mutase [Bacteroidales bacterium]|nr:phospho-sugar mutase [Bacteroidales bacterium]MBR6161102.1 phospho-sugar mutase [Bacteroidales bacterium]
MEQAIQEKIDIWLNENYDQETKKEILKLQKKNPQELVEAFYRNLEFGTGGLRGIMGVGTNRMNKYTVGFATQGLANYLTECFRDSKVSVVISHDSRLNSRQFAEIAADILSANKIKVYLFEDLRPTPELSFAVRHLKCNAGIMITASHNPKEYNGYKVYWQDGGQLVPPHDKNVIQEVNKITSIQQVKWTGNKRLIHIIGEQVDKAYLKNILRLSVNPTAVKKAKNLKIVYTPLHGTGITMVPKALEMYGFNNIIIEEQQAIPDGNFPTVKSPNPEEKTALELALKKADEVDADLILATDPDADRVGIAVRDTDGTMKLLNGNQTGTLLFHYMLSQLQSKKKMPENPFVVKTIVTTDLISRIAMDFNVACDDVLTGFKYIAEDILRNEGKQKFIVGGEESYGYLVGDFVRDKDAVSACCLIAEMAAYYHAFGKPNHKLLIEILHDIYRSYGFFKEDLLSLTKKGKAGVEEIQQMMADYRSNPPKTLGGQPVVMMKDYAVSKSYDFTYNTNSIINLPTSNVLQFFTADGSKVTVRPSGTEPKIKFYFSVVNPIKKRANIADEEAKLTEKIEQMKKEMVQ